MVGCLISITNTHDKPNLVGCLLWKYSPNWFLTGLLGAIVESSKQSMGGLMFNHHY